MTDFAAALRRPSSTILHPYPVHATAVGDHRVDDRWPDCPTAGRAERLAFIDRWTRDVRGRSTDLDGDEAIDRDLLLGELEAHASPRSTCARTPGTRSSGSTSLGDGLFTLLAREFAPLADRLASIAGRLEGLPALLDGRRAALRAPTGGRSAASRPRRRIEQLPGIDELIGEALAAGRRRGAERPGGRGAPAAARARRPRRPGPRSTAFEAHLRDVVLPASEGEGRLGAELFAAQDAPHDALRRR